MSAGSLTLGRVQAESLGVDGTSTSAGPSVPPDVADGCYGDDVGEANSLLWSACATLPCGRPEIRSRSTMWMVATGCETCSGARSSAVIDGVCRTLPTVTVCGVRSGSRAAWRRTLRYIRWSSGAPGIDHLLGEGREIEQAGPIAM